VLLTEEDIPEVKDDTIEKEEKKIHTETNYGGFGGKLN